MRYFKFRKDDIPILKQWYLFPEVKHSEEFTYVSYGDSILELEEINLEEWNSI